MILKGKPIFLSLSKRNQRNVVAHIIDILSLDVLTVQLLFLWLDSNMVWLYYLRSLSQA